MSIIDYLDEQGVSYELTEHQPAFSAQRMAAAEHEPGRYVAKPVIVRADERYYMCVLPAPYKVNLNAFKQKFGTEKAELAEEDEIARIFDDCELGAEPPFGNLYDLPTIMDKSLEKDDHIVFQAGSHKKAVRLSMDDYKRLVQPEVADFSYETTS